MSDDIDTNGVNYLTHAGDPSGWTITGKVSEINGYTTSGLTATYSARADHEPGGAPFQVVTNGGFEAEGTWPETARHWRAETSAKDGSWGWHIKAANNGNVYPTPSNFAQTYTGRTINISADVRLTAGTANPDDVGVVLILQRSNAATATTILRSEDLDAASGEWVHLEWEYQVVHPTNPSYTIVGIKVAPWVATNANGAEWDFDNISGLEMDNTMIVPEVGQIWYVSNQSEYRRWDGEMWQHIDDVIQTWLYYYISTPVRSGMIASVASSTDTAPVEPGGIATFSMLGYFDWGMYVRLGIVFTDDNGTVVGDQRGDAVSTQGQELLSFSANVPERAAEARAYFEVIPLEDIDGDEYGDYEVLYPEWADARLTVWVPEPTPVVETRPREDLTYSRVGRLPWDRDPWVLSYPGTELRFGTLASNIVLDAAPDFGTRSFITEDATIPRSDGRTFGQDFLEGQTITFSLAVHGKSEHECRKLLDQISSAWRGDAIRFNPGAVAELTSDVGRTYFGRPRRFTFNGEELPLGVALVTCDFETADDASYGPEHSATVAFYPELGGGLIAPLAAPLGTTRTSDRSRPFRIEGNTNAWPIIDIVGPVTNPQVEIIGDGVTYSYTLRTTLREGQSVTLDSRPFVRSVLRNDRVSLAGTLTRTSTRLSQSALAPGTYELVMRGDSHERTATASVRWREAYGI